MALSNSCYDFDHLFRSLYVLMNQISYFFEETIPQIPYPTLWRRTYVILFCWISGIFFLLNCRNKSERIFAVLFCCLLGTRDGRCLQKQRVFGCCGNYFHSAVLCFCRPWFLSNLHLSYKWTFTPTSFKKSTEGQTKRKVVNNKPQHVSLLLLN